MARLSKLNICANSALGARSNFLTRFTGVIVTLTSRSREHIFRRDCQRPASAIAVIHALRILPEEILEGVDRVLLEGLLTRAFFRGTMPGFGLNLRGCAAE